MSTDGTSPNGHKPAARPTRDIRDRPLARVAILIAVLLVAFAATRSCARQQHKISQDEAVAIAKRNVAFTPCNETGCVLVRFLNQGIPVRGTWIVGLAPALDADGHPVRARTVLIDAETGAVTRR